MDSKRETLLIPQRVTVRGEADEHHEVGPSGLEVKEQAAR
jgi:hypothetical protein